MALRLTLRTLMAYLDDTLEPTAARDLGQKIVGNARAEMVIERLKTVLKPSRIPPVASNTSEPIEINDLAEYLDGQLDQESVEDVERRCLDSNENLAEVASLHQILTLATGKPPVIPDRARERMLQLGDPSRPRRRRHEQAPGLKLGNQSKVPASVSNAGKRPTSRTGFRQLIRLAATMLLIPAIGFVVWQALWPTFSAMEREGQPAFGRPPAVPVPAEPAANPANANQDANKPAVALTEPPAPADPIHEPANLDEPIQPADADALPAIPDNEPPTPPANAEPADEPVEPAAEPETKGPPPPVVPPTTTAIGNFFTESQNGAPVLLVRRLDQTTRMEPGASVRTADELIGLDGYRSQIKLHNHVMLDMVGRSRLTINSAADDSLAVTLPVGQVIVQSADAPVTLEVGFAGESFTVRMLAGHTGIGLESRASDIANNQSLRRRIVHQMIISALQGDVVVEKGSETRDLSPGEQLVVQEAVGLLPATESTASTDWGFLIDDNSSQNRTFIVVADLIAVGTSPTLTFREMISDRSRLKREFAIWGLAGMDDDSLLVDALAHPTYEDVRQSAGSALRWRLCHDPSADQQILELVRKMHPAELTDRIMDLLWGYPSAAEGDAQLLRELVDLLNSESIAVREPANVNLQELTGRKLGYDASAPFTRRRSIMNQWLRIPTP